MRLSALGWFIRLEIKRRKNIGQINLIGLEYGCSLARDWEDMAIWLSPKIG